MKKALLIVLALVLALACCGCSYNKVVLDNKNSDGRITVLYIDCYVTLYRDEATGVQYISSPYGGICVVVNQDGTPYTGEEDK